MHSTSNPIRMNLITLIVADQYPKKNEWCNPLKQWNESSHCWIKCKRRLRHPCSLQTNYNCLCFAFSKIKIIFRDECKMPPQNGMAKNNNNTHCKLHWDNEATLNLCPGLLQCWCRNTRPVRSNPLWWQSSLHIHPSAIICVVTSKCFN